MPLYEFRGVAPKVGKTSWVHETAQIIGDVEIGEDCFIGPGAAIRGDFGPIRIGDRTSVQDNSVLHCRLGERCVVGDEVTIGHAAVLHGCTVGNRTIIGINSTVADGAFVGADCIIAEGAVVRTGMKIPEGSLAAGVPAVIKAQLNDEQRIRKDMAVKTYVQINKQYFTDLKKL